MIIFILRCINLVKMENNFQQEDLNGNFSLQKYCIDTPDKFRMFGIPYTIQDQ
jgi:hypothetical protein